jgi:hypothetical protein
MIVDCGGEAEIREICEPLGAWNYIPLAALSVGMGSRSSGIRRARRGYLQTESDERELIPTVSDSSIAIKSGTPIT